MSFLDINNSEYLTARITQKGRNAIAKGDFKISYFSIGDSEFVYTSPFNQISGSVLTGTTHQGVFAPLDKDTHVKYPLQYTSGSSIYGIPVTGSTTEIIRNVMGPAGFVSEYNSFYSGTTVSGSTIETLVVTGSMAQLSGVTTLTLDMPVSKSFVDSEYITLLLNTTVVSGSLNYISGSNNSLTYKLNSISSSVGTLKETLTFDREVPLLSGLTGNFSIIANKGELEFPSGSDVDYCAPILPETTAQQNPWTVDVVWDKNPIGFDVTTSDAGVESFVSSKYVSTKELLGYMSTTGQTFIDFTGGTITGTTYKNVAGDEIILPSNEQKCVAIIHFSEIGDIVNDPDRFFKYDDYISSKTGITDSDISIIDDRDGETPISDTDYFELYIPHLNYHRNTGSTIGAIFYMDTNDYYVKSTLNEKATFKYRYLIDEQGVKVGKVFVDKKIVVIDDEDIVATLDYKSNRKYTLPAPKLGLIPPTGTTYTVSGNTNSMWISYVFSGNTTSGTTLNSLPCNYFQKITGFTNSNITFNFSGSTGFQHMSSVTSDLTDKFVANKFYLLAQSTTTGSLPDSNMWKAIDFTSELTTSTGNIVPSSLTGTTFTLTYEKYTGGTTFDLTTHLNDNFTTGSINFGSEQPLPGSVRLVRATDIEEMNFLVNLPSGKFTYSRNPTLSGATSNPMITEVALLNDSKETMVMAKTSKPIKREGTQVFAVRLDF